MRIGINCTAIDPAYVGGLNTYTLGLLGGFAGVPSGHRYRLFVTPKNAEVFRRFASLRSFSIEVLHGTTGVARRLGPKLAEFAGSPTLYRHASDLALRSASRAMERGCDLLYTPTTVLRPFTSRRPQLLSMHDIQHVHYPEFFSRSQVRQRTLTHCASAASATWFQASSSFLKDDLLAHFSGLKADQVVVIPEGVDINAFRVASSGMPAQARYGLPERFLFYPAQLWPHKNHLTVLKALHRIRDDSGRELPLVLTGAAYGAAPAIRDYISTHGLRGVRYLGAVPAADIVALYRASWYTMTAVLYESSSLCMLEGAAAGAPLVASSTPPNVEMSRVLNINLFDPLDHGALADLLRRLWDDEPGRERQRRENAERVHYYSWANAARRYLDFIDRVAGAGAG